MEKKKINKVMIIASIIYIIILGILLTITVNNINTLKKENEALKRDYEANNKALIERNQELYICKMEKDEWKELFYNAIDFHPDESYPY